MSSSTTTVNTSWSCAQCSSTFDKSKLLERHALQTSHKAYKCLICPKVFGKRTALIRHKTIHSDVKSHVCRVCEKAFYRKDHCLEHEEVCTHRLAVETRARLSASLPQPRSSPLDHTPESESGNSRKRHRAESGDGDLSGTPLSEAGQRLSSPRRMSGSEPSSQQHNINEHSSPQEHQGRASVLHLSGDHGYDPHAGHPEAMAVLRQHYDAVDSNPHTNAPDHGPGSGNSGKRHHLADGKRDMLGKSLSEQSGQRPSSARRILDTEHSTQQSDFYEQSNSPGHGHQGRPPVSNSPRSLTIEAHDTRSNLGQFYALMGAGWNTADDRTPTTARDPPTPLVDSAPDISTRQSPANHSSREPTPVHTFTSNTGTYTCTYHGCTRRFDSHQSLQRHKRDFHRPLPAGEEPVNNVMPPEIRIDYAPPAPGGQPDDRSSIPAGATNPQLTSTDSDNRYVASSFWFSLTNEIQALKDVLEEDEDEDEDEDDSGKQDRASTPPKATNIQRSVTDSASQHVAGSFVTSLIGESESLRTAFGDIDKQASNITTSSSGTLSRASYWIRQPRILLVEDDLTCRRIASKFLYSFDCVIETAVDGLEAVNKVVTSPMMEVDLILMDTIMPNLDGVSAMHLIRQTQRTLPIIIMSSNIRAEDISMYFQHGASDVLPKPFTKEGMFRQLEKHLQHLIRKSINATSSSAAAAPLAIGRLPSHGPDWF